MPAGRGLRTGTSHWGYPSHRMRGRPTSDQKLTFSFIYTSHRMRGGTLLVKPRRRFKWNEMANCGDAYVFFDPLGSSVSMLSSNSQTLAPHNGCQEVVSKGGLDRIIRPTRSSITLTFNTLGENNKNHQLSRGSKPLNVRQHITGNTLMKSQTSDRKNQELAFFRASVPVSHGILRQSEETFHFSGRQETVLKLVYSYISPDSAYKTKENHIKEMFLLIKARHNVADYHRIIKFVIGGMEIVLAECRERH